MLVGKPHFLQITELYMYITILSIELNICSMYIIFYIHVAPWHEPIAKSMTRFPYLIDNFIVFILSFLYLS